MKNSLKILSGILLGVIVIIVSLSSKKSPSDSAVYYVDSVSGNDNNNGISPNTAWKSLDKVNSLVFKPGDSILFKANCSWTGKLEPKGSGNNSKQIIVSMYGYETIARYSRNKPHIEGNGIYATRSN